MQKLRFCGFVDLYSSRRPKGAPRNTRARLNRLLAGLVFTLILATSSPAQSESEATNTQEADARYTHKLMPGIVARQLWDVNWPRTQHDRLATGFSPLVCGMRQAPAVWGEVVVGGSLNSLSVVAGPGDPQCLLVDDGRLRLLNSAGGILWTRSSVGSLIGAGDLKEDGGRYALWGAGPRVILLNLDTGDEIWRHVFEPAYVQIQGEVADILVNRPGLEAALFLKHGEEGCLVSFPPHAEPDIVWQRSVVDGEFNERYDHHNATIQLDLSHPDEPVIWNLRRHRCRGFDARTGERLSTITYAIGGAQRRNYGPMYLGHGRDGQLMGCVFGQRVQVHAHAIRLHRDQPNELAWQHYYGEVYKEAPGVTLDSHGVVDIDDDGADEMVYSVRDPAFNFRSFVRFRDVDSGEIKFELPDRWGIGTFSNVGPDKTTGFLALVAPAGQTPRIGELEVYSFSAANAPQLIGTVRAAGSWGQRTVAGHQGDELLLREQDTEGVEWLSRFVVTGGKLQRVARTDAAQLLAQPIRVVLNDSDASSIVCVASSEGEIRAHTWEGKQLWSQALQGSAASAVSAADLDGDGRAELVAAMADGRIRVFSCESDGSIHERRSFEHLVGWHNHHPVIYDLLGDGKLCVLTAGSNGSGHLVIRAHLLDGTTIWETPLTATVEDLRGLILNPGQFLAEDHAGVAVSMTDARLIHEGTYMLDGRSGELMWFKGLHRDGNTIMPYRPNGIPTAYDFDQDGVEEIGMDMLSYMAFLRGSDGEFAYLRHTRNLRTEDAVFGGHLYNTFCPLFKTATDINPHWFVTAGFGPFGLMNPDPRYGVWLEDLDYDVPRNIALVDVDGDGALEAGYSARNSTQFVCRDVWTGNVEWAVDLPSAPNATTITADMDGDGRGEFFCGQYCIGVNSQGKGEIRWRCPVHLGWPVIADFDGDGLGEIAGGQAGKIVILKARE